jgi:hypothetical protein
VELLSFDLAVLFPLNSRKPSAVALLGATALVVAICTAPPANAQVVYPFDLPDEITATLNVDTTRKRPVNHMLLGLNCNWPEGLYGKVGYNHPDAQDLIKKLKPSSLRFPHGVWANFYDWESDGRRITDHYKTPYDSAVKGHPDLKYGFDGFHKLHQELEFDVLLTFNVNYDRPEKAARRLIDRRDKGFDVKWVELGNEIFWKTQRSDAVVDVERYIDVSKAHATALKAVAPDVLISIPAHWRTAETNPWNLAVKQHRYYDAVTLHKHMGTIANRGGAAATLDARRLMVQTGETLRKVFPDLPIWVSEWSVGCGERENAIGILGMADVYLGFFEHPELFGIADYFQINASHKLIAYDDASGTHSRTGFGAAYEIIRDVFEHAEIYNSSIESTTVGDGLDAVSAAAVVKDGNVTVFTINKTTRSVPLHLKFDDSAYTRPLAHQTLSFTDANDTRSFELDENLLSDVTSADESRDGVFILPPLSLNRFDRPGGR